MTAALKASIRDVESRIYRRRDDIGITFGVIVHNVRERIISPATIIAAGLLGAAIQRDHRLHGLRMLTILQSAYAGLRHLLFATFRIRVMPD